MIPPGDRVPLLADSGPLHRIAEGGTACRQKGRGAPRRRLPPSCGRQRHVLALEFAMDFRPVRLDLATMPLLAAGGSKPPGPQVPPRHLLRPRPSQKGQLGSDCLSDARRVHRAIHRVRGARCDLSADAIFAAPRSVARRGAVSRLRRSQTAPRPSFAHLRKTDAGAARGPHVYPGSYGIGIEGSGGTPQISDAHGN
jgi:hypothetical protein